MPEVSVEETVAGTPEAVYDLVSDVTRMGEWSPETTSCAWTGGASGPRPGARFRGRNRSGWRRWSTTCTVVDAKRGTRFSFDVTVGALAIARWVYDFAADGDGCRVRETWIDRRPGWLSRLDPWFMGIPDRSEHNRTTMRATLAALRRHTEEAAASR